MKHERHKYFGFLGLLSLIGLKGFTTGRYEWFIFFIAYGFFTFFYENSPIYKLKKLEIRYISKS